VLNLRLVAWPNGIDAPRRSELAGLDGEESHQAHRYGVCAADRSILKRL
jgi:hypothetical protein